MQKLLFLFIMQSLFLNSYSQEQKVPSILNKLEKDEFMQNCSWSLKVIDFSSGKQIVSKNSSMCLTPASTAKTIAIASGFLTLGEDFRFKTELKYLGAISDSTLFGNLIIKGYGDPTIGSKTDVFTPIDSIFYIWQDSLKAHGIKKIHGKIIADDSFFEDENFNNNWLWEDLSVYYGTKTNALCFYENKYTINFQTPQIIGDSVKISSVYPNIANTEIKNKIIASDKKTSPKNYIYSFPFDSSLYILEGSIPILTDNQKTEGANRFAPITLVKYFADFLEKNSSGGNSITLEERKHKEDTSINEKTLFTYYSTPYQIIAQKTMEESNNFFTEQILRQIGNSFGNSKTENSIDSMLVYLNKELNLDTKKILLKDASGLSRKNFVNCDFFCDFLVKMQKSSKGQEFLNSFSSPTKYPHIKAKSGSMSGVKNYCGYSLNEKGQIKYVFCVMINNFSEKTSEAQKRIDKIFEFLKN